MGYTFHLVPRGGLWLLYHIILYLGEVYKFFTTSYPTRKLLSYPYTTVLWLLYNTIPYPTSSITSVRLSYPYLTTNLIPYRTQPSLKSVGTFRETQTTEEVNVSCLEYRQNDDPPVMLRCGYEKKHNLLRSVTLRLSTSRFLAVNRNREYPCYFMGIKVADLNHLDRS